MSWIEPKSEEERQACIARGLESVRVNVCWRCGGGGHNKKTLFRVGETDERVTIYGCQEHRGLQGQLR